MVRVTLSETELQMLRPGEFYDVPPAVGRVLVSEGWAVAPDPDGPDPFGISVEAAHDAHSEPRSS